MLHLSRPLFNIAVMSPKCNHYLFIFMPSVKSQFFRKQRFYKINFLSYKTRVDTYLGIFFFLEVIQSKKNDPGEVISEKFFVFTYPINIILDSLKIKKNTRSFQKNILVTFLFYFPCQLVFISLLI